MERLTSLVSSSGKSLSPANAVLLYRQLYVLKNFLEYGTAVANQIRVGYAEEFRYSIYKDVFLFLVPFILITAPFMIGAIKYSFYNLV